MLKIKSGVEPPNLILAAAIANCSEGRETTITSGHDGEHMTGSRHYDGAALDVRSKNFRTADKMPFVKAVISRLGEPVEVLTKKGSGYQTKDGRYIGILENKGKAQEHFHFEQN